MSAAVGDLDALAPSHLMYGRRLTTLSYDLNPEIINDPNYEPTPVRLRETNNRQAKIMSNFNRVFRTIIWRLYVSIIKPREAVMLNWSTSVI